ncbi:MAG TPA: zinc metallopeptidase [Eubacteriales bacterium]|nr:zinc metallopeptidase [Eubacteriales bacterium]
MYFSYGSTDMIYILLLFAVMGISFYAQSRVQKTFNQFAQTPVSSGMRAEMIAQSLLDRAGSTVQIESVQGSLTDHFDPKNRIVGLSTQVYGSNSIAAVAVAAHEIGHVMQYENNYVPIRLRNAILPVASIGSYAAPWIVILGLFMGSYNLAMIGVVLFGAMLVFQIVTLPVEFNASSRALRMLEEGNYITYEESDGAKKVLKAAAMTYVWAAVASLVSFLRLLALANRTRR